MDQTNDTQFNIYSSFPLTSLLCHSSYCDNFSNKVQDFPTYLDMDQYSAAGADRRKASYFMVFVEDELLLLLERISYGLLSTKRPFKAHDVSQLFLEVKIEGEKKNGFCERK